MLDDPIKLQETALPELLERREQLSHQKEEIEAEMVVINQEILLRLETEKVNGLLVGEHQISKATRYSFKTPIEWAQEHGAVKQALDNAKLKKLLLSGVDVPEVNKSTYVLVKRIERDES